MILVIFANVGDFLMIFVILVILCNFQKTQAWEAGSRPGKRGVDPGKRGVDP